jgi:O-antigen/teichoic acid export membrane protein
MTQRETVGRPAVTRGTRGSLGAFGIAVLIYQVAQVGWLFFASREMSTKDLAAVLTALAVFAVLFLVVDNGTSYLGARMAARRQLRPVDHASVTKVRLVLGASAGVVGLAIALSGGLRTALAFAPYGVALVLIGALNVWEWWGRGYPAPLATWIALRGGGLIGLAAIFYAIGSRLPVWAPGLVECASVVCVSRGFRLGVARQARAALRAGPGPWRSAMLIGLPAVLGQLALSSGVVILNNTGPAVAAATFAVGVRVISGLNNGAGLLTSALFPRLAHEDRAQAVGGGPMVRFMLLTVVGIGCLGVAAGCLAHHAILHAFLGARQRTDAATLIATLSAATVTGATLTLASVLVARNHERDVFRATLTGAAMTVLAGVAVAALATDAAGTWIGAALLAGTSLTMALLVWSSRRVAADERAAIKSGASACFVAVLVALPAIATTSAAAACGVAELVLGVGAFVGAVRATGVVKLAGWPKWGASLGGHLARTGRGYGRPARLLIMLVIPVLAAAVAAAVVYLHQKLLVPLTAAGAITLSVLLLAWARRRGQLLSPPVILGIPLLLGLAAAMAPVTRTHWDWSSASLAASWGIALAPLAGMAAVGLLAPPSASARPVGRDTVPPPNPARIVWTCAVLVGLGVVVQLITFARQGSIPLFSSAIDVARIGFQHPGPLYLLSDGLMLSAIVASWARFGWADRFSPLQRKVLTGIVFIVPLFLTLQGGRFVAAAPAIAAFVAARPYLSRRTLRRVGVAAAVVGALFSVALLGVRFHQASAQNPLSARIFYTASGTPRSFPSVLWNGLLINLGEGYRVADEFRRSHISVPSPSTSVYFLHRFLPQAQDPQTYALALSGLWITSTYAGPVILDEGIGAALLFGFVLGAVIQAVYVRRARASGPFAWWLYAYLAANFAFLFYVELPSLEPYLWIDPFAMYVLYRFLMPAARVSMGVISRPDTGSAKLRATA